MNDESYLRVLEAYRCSKLIQVFKLESKKFSIALVLCIIILFGSVLIEIYLKLGFEMFLVSGFGFYFYITKLSKSMNKKLLKLYPNIESFLKEHKLYWASQRSFLFFQVLYKNGNTAVPESVFKMIETEVASTEINILKIPFFTGIFALIGVLLNKIIDKLNISLPSTIMFTLILFLAALFLYGVIDVIRPKSQKLHELKLFALWYNDFGYKLMKDQESEIIQINHAANKTE